MFFYWLLGYLTILFFIIIFNWGAHNLDGGEDNE